MKYETSVTAAAKHQTVGWRLIDQSGCGLDTWGRDVGVCCFHTGPVKLVQPGGGEAASDVSTLASVARGERLNLR